MNQAVMNKIDLLLESVGVDEVRRSVNQFRGGDAVGYLPIIHPIGAAHAGYKAGSEMGHPYAGFFLGQEGAAGAVSKYDPNVKLADVYSKQNLLKRGTQGLALGLGVAGMQQYEVDHMGDRITRIANNALKTGAFDQADYDEAMNEVKKLDDDVDNSSLKSMGLGTLAGLATPAIAYGLGKVFGGKPKNNINEGKK